MRIGTLSPSDSGQCPPLPLSELRSPVVSTPRSRPGSCMSGALGEFIMRILSRCVSVLLLTGLLSAAACNTMEGVGKDVQSAGGAVEDAAK